MTVLTSTVINNAEIKDKIYYIWDDMVKGFALKVIPNGQKKYIIKYRTAMGGRSGVQRWYIFGDIQNLSCKEAREEAAKLFRMIHEGKDPQAEKASLREADTLTEFWELYVKDYASLKENKENYLKHTEPLWRLYIKPVLGNRKITDINNLDIEHLHRSLARVKYNANRTLSLLNLLFNLMEKWNLRPPHTNPCRCVQRYKEDLRIRYLSSEEMARFTKELRDAETRKPEMVYTVAAIRLLLLTAARKNEILTCKWEWVDFDNHLINLPTSKTGKKTIFLNSKAVEILKELEVELMRQDIKRNKCKYTLSTYKRAVDYVMTTLLKETIGEREFLEMEYSYRNDGCKLRGMQYRKALEFGLFDEFDSVLDKMAKEGYHG